MCLKTSNWHHEWQNIFPPENQGVVIQWKDIRHRADILTERTAIEFQNSPLPSGEFNDRNVFYGNIGYKAVWLCDMRDEYATGNISEIKADQFSLHDSLAFFRQYIIKSGRIDLFLQISEKDKCIMQIREFNENGFKIKAKFTKDEFLQYAGIQNGVCLPPVHIDNENYQQFAKKYKIQLNPQQQRAVQAVNGANLMVAVPGSGKTTVMIARMGYMIYCRGISPENILSITYTKNAKNDIKQRFADKFGLAMAERLNICTINALCEKIINRYVRIFNRERFTLLNESEQKAILRRIYTEVTEDKFPHDADIIKAQTFINYVKNMMLTTPDLRAEHFPKDTICENIYIKYIEILKQQRRMDFDDQLIYARIFLKKFPCLLDEFQEKYQYICVDEAQDTSKIQHDIIRILALKRNNIFMVGDEDQSIYRFRGAYPQALMDFTDNYKNPYTMFLETNYRSTEQIVNMAQNFISCNVNRHSEKNMKVNRGTGNPIEIISVRKKHEQYLILSARARAEHGSLAVLYRNNDSDIPIMDLFLRNNIPYRRLNNNGENFFKSRVVQDIKYFLRFAVNPNDAEAFMKIYYKCGYKIKENIAFWSCQKAKSKGTAITDELIKQMAQYSSLKKKLKYFKSKMNTISALPPHNAIAMINRFWYDDYAKEKGLDTGKIDILYSLAVNEDSIENFLKRLEILPCLIENYKCTDENPVILSTIHSAKGLEFDAVYLVDAYDGCLPHIDRKTAKEHEKIDIYEEERRIFYVAITRAKNELHLFSIKECPCSFINEIIPHITI